MIQYLDLRNITAMHGEEISEAVLQVVNGGWYLRGEATRHFEAEYAKYIGSSFCVGCGNGLDALRLILMAYKEMGVMTDGDEVIVPANTYIASILAISSCGLTPVLVEPSLSTMQIDDSQIEKHITAKTRAIMIVHLYGCCAYTPKIAQLCRQYGLKLIEDNAQAHGCSYVETKPDGYVCYRHTGSLGDSAAHSFYPGKNLGALGDAGAVTTNDEELATLVSTLGNYGSSKKYVFDYQGVNSRIDDLQAAVLDVKLKYLDQDNEYRRELAALLSSLISHPDVTLPDMDNPVWKSSIFHVFPVLCCQRDQLQQHLLGRGIGTIVHYPIPPHSQRCYQGVFSGTYPITDMLHQQELSLPCNPAMTTMEIETVAQAVNDFLI